MTDAEVHDLTVGLQRAAHRLAAATTRAVGVWDARRGWSDDGSKSAGARLARECEMSEPSANTVVHRARKLRTMPATTAAFAAGALSPDAVDLLARVNTAKAAALFARDEQVLVEQCRRLRYASAKRSVAYWHHCADDDGTGRDARARHDRRSGSAARTPNDMVHGRAWLDPVGGGIFLNELQRLERQLYRDDLAAAHARLGRPPSRHELDRDAGQRMADAYVEMARRSGSLNRPPSARPLLTVLVGWETLQGRICQLADGTVLHPSQLDDLLADCDIERVVFDGPSRIIDISVRQRFFTGGLRRAIEIRDQHCTHPAGCDTPYEHCDIDHTVPHAAGGRTHQENGRLRCPTHNRDEQLRNASPRGSPPDDPVAAAHREHRNLTRLARQRLRELARSVTTPSGPAP